METTSHAGIYQSGCIRKSEARCQTLNSTLESGSTCCSLVVSSRRDGLIPPTMMLHLARKVDHIQCLYSYVWSKFYYAYRELWCAPIIASGLTELSILLSIVHLANRLSPRGSQKIFYCPGSANVFKVAGLRMRSLTMLGQMGQNSRAQIHA